MATVKSSDFNHTVWAKDIGGFKWDKSSGNEEGVTSWFILVSSRYNLIIDLICKMKPIVQLKMTPKSGA